MGDNKSKKEEKALRKELRENTLSSKRSVLIAFMLVILFMALGLGFDYFETKIFRNIFLALMFMSFGYFGVSFIATLWYVLYDKTGSTNPAKLFDKKSEPLRVAKTQLWKFFIIKEFIND